MPFCQQDGNCQSQFSNASGPLDPDVPCKIACFQFLTPPCDFTALIQNAPCGADGACSPAHTSVPAASNTGLFLIAAALGVVGVVALLRRRAIARFLGVL